MYKKKTNIIPKNELLHSSTFREQQVEINIMNKDPPLQYLPEKYPQRRYVGGTIKSQAVHGQLKLLLRIIQSMNYICKDQQITELNKSEFLSRCTMIYPGMASGRNMILIHEMYPEMKIEGTDPAKYDPDLIKLAKDKSNNIKLITGFFTDESAKEYYTRYEKDRNKHILIFVSDIRLSPNEDSVEADMKNQEKWTNIIRPDYSVLKCRYPWDERNQEKFKYLPGVNQLQHFAPYNSTETALISKFNDIGKSIEIDSYAYQDKMFYFNTVTRLQLHKTWLDKYYPGIVDQIAGLYYCNDCTGFIYTIHQYFVLFNIELNMENMLKYVDKCIKLTHGRGINMLSYYINKQFSLTIPTKGAQLLSSLKGLSLFIDSVKDKQSKIIAKKTVRNQYNNIFKTLIDPMIYYMDKMSS